jgi:PTS system nitrogen regulatory IIA component
MHLSSILPQEAVIARVLARDKKQVLRQLSVYASAITPLSEREIFTVLQQREQVGCTGMGHGVCIPHGRFDGLSSVKAMFIRLERAVDFDAADGRPVDLVFLLLTPSSANTDHIKALAVVSRLLRDKGLCESLRKAEDAATLHRLLTQEAG